MRKPDVRRSDPELARRLPPDQHLEEGFPIMHEGETPRLAPADWDLKAWGLVAKERRFGWDEFLALPQVEVVSDFHCVTGWTRLDNVWRGVRFRDFVAAVAPKAEARHVMVYGHLCDDPYGYSADMPLAALLDDDVLLAHMHDGQPLSPEHGAPVRLVVPKRFAWKSVKWLRAVEFLAEAHRGYWEVRGYHPEGEPFAGERHDGPTPPKVRPQQRGKDYT